MEEPDAKKTPRVLRGLSSPRGPKKDGQGKALSGSRGGQSSWAYVNFAFEKDVDLILSPKTLKRRKEEREAKGNGLKEDTMRRKDETEGNKSKGSDSVREIVGARDNEKVEMKTFGRGLENRSDEISGRTGDKSNTSKTRRTSGTPNSWPMSKAESDTRTARWEREEILRGYENLATLDVAEKKGGFRPKQLTREWDADAWREAKKGHGGADGEGSGRKERGDGERDVVGEKLTPRDDGRSGSSKGSRPPRIPALPLSSHFSTSTKLLLSPEDEEEEEEGRDRSSPAHKGYSSTLPRASSKEGVLEGEISFFADGRKRDFKYYSAP